MLACQTSSPNNILFYAPQRSSLHPTCPSLALALLYTLLFMASLVCANLGLLSSSALAKSVSPSFSRQDMTNADLGESFSGNFLAGIVAGADRDTKSAELFLTRALQADPRNVDLQNQIFLTALTNGNIAKASQFAKSLSKRVAHNNLIALLNGLEALKQSDYTKAKSQFLKAGGSGRMRDLTAILLSTWCDVGLGKTKTALGVLDSLEEPSFAVFKNYLAALMADIAHNPLEAEKRYALAFSMEKNTLRLVEAYASFLSRQGKNDKAQEILTNFNTAHPAQPIILGAIATLKSGKPLPALVSNAKEGAAELLFGLGSIGGRPNDELASLIYLRLALYLQPNHEAALLALAETAELIKQTDSALEIYKSIAPSSAVHNYAQIQAALLLDESGKNNEAVNLLNHLIDSGGESVESLSALGHLQRGQKHYDDAAATYSRAIAMLSEPKRQNWPLFYFRGICYERQNQWDKAEADFTKALELSPDQPLVLNYLGYSWVDRNLNLDKALTMLQRAVDLSPRDGFILDSLGWAHFKLGNIARAQSDIERAIEIKPSDPTINDHLGDIYWRQGRKLEAQFQWNHARDLHPEPDDLKKILEKIAHGLKDPTPVTQNAEKIPQPPSAIGDGETKPQNSDGTPTNEGTKSGG